jgi:adenylyltransferase/sulfurtransferase
MALSDDELERYARHIVLKDVGGPGQARLKAASVLVIGAGGLGSPLILYLAAAGVGRIGVVDFDTVALSNLQRQIAHRTQDVGLPKTVSAAQAASAINPHVEIVRHELRLSAATAPALLQAYDLVADGSDNFETRFMVNDAAYAARRTLVSAAVTGFDGQLATFKPHAGEFPCYRCLFPAPPPPGSAPTCSEAGVLGAVAGVMGTLQAVEVLKELLDIGQSMAGRLLIYDALGGRLREVKVRKDPQCTLCGS